MFQLSEVIRENIKHLKPYSSARDEFTGEASIYLDANENSFGSPLLHWYNRYPDPLQKRLKEKLANIKGIPPANIFLGNGSDECIDVLQRICCEPGRDNIIICPPTYGMYEVCAAINDVAVKSVPLTPEFQLDLPAIEQAIDDHTKMIFVCSPNNPTGNALHRADMELLLDNYFGLLVVDEAYVNFSRHKSMASALRDYPQLVILQTLSKAWGLAGLRIGLALASEELVNIMNKVKPPYNINQASQELALTALDEVDQVNEMIRAIVEQRASLREKLARLSLVKKIYPSDANFLLVEVTQPRAIYEFLLQQGIVVRDRSRVMLCEGCLRITVGTPLENETLIRELIHFSEQVEKPELS